MLTGSVAFESNSENLSERTVFTFSPLFEKRVVLLLESQTGVDLLLLCLLFHDTDNVSTVLKTVKTNIKTFV